MRKEYDLEQLTMRRRGPLPGMAEAAGQPAKVRITIALDEDVVGHFKAQAAKPGGLPYQTQINQALRRAMALSAETEKAAAEDLRAALLADPGFIRTVAEKVSNMLRPARAPKVAEGRA